MSTMKYCPGCECYRRVEEEADRLVCMVCGTVCGDATEEPEVALLHTGERVE